ncbi:unnamed protein product [marine sediment metagenome]|uniref:Uncharacterized protein n=1 Tax=marine sediment metagenome TaxID=412755 RepID=X0WLS1_9ZZZZ
MPKILTGENEKCKTCENSGLDWKKLYCILSGRDITEYDPEDECVNHKEAIIW